MKQFIEFWKIYIVRKQCTNMATLTFLPYVCDLLSRRILKIYRLNFFFTGSLHKSLLSIYNVSLWLINKNIYSALNITENEKSRNFNMQLKNKNIFDFFFNFGEAFYTISPCFLIKNMLHYFISVRNTTLRIAGIWLPWHF